jgi:hypothetical protein
LIERSARHFDPVLWRFIIEKHGYITDGGFARTREDYQSARDLTLWFREHLVRGNTYTLAQLELAAERLQEFVSFATSQFLLPNDEATTDHRKAFLMELEDTMQAIETRLPRSTLVYAVRGDLLRLQEMCVDEGINTRSPDELRAASERHRMVASALGVGSSVADLLASALKSYTDEDANGASKSSAISTAQSSLRD